jgi:hypothetical protein
MTFTQVKYLQARLFPTQVDPLTLLHSKELYKYWTRMEVHCSNKHASLV